MQNQKRKSEHPNRGWLAIEKKKTTTAARPSDPQKCDLKSNLDTNQIVVAMVVDAIWGVAVVDGAGRRQ